MRPPAKAFLAIMIAIGFTVGLSKPARAYVDPNSGGLLFQLLTPIVALMTAGLTFARRQLLRLWDGVMTGLKTLATRFFKI